MHLLFSILQKIIFLVKFDQQVHGVSFFVVTFIRFEVSYGCNVRMQILRLKVYASLQT
jgi:hypothetical protein